MLYFINSLIDDDNRVILIPILGQQDCQNDYINASFLDVSIFQSTSKNTLKCFDQLSIKIIF